MSTDYIPNIDHKDFLPGRQNEADKTLLVKFFKKPRKDNSASEKEGRPIYRDVEYVDIKIPGNRNAGACRPATDQDRRRFPDHYRAFKERTDVNVNEGTPLAEWPVVSRSMAEELSFFHVKTVEQLATMADSQVAKFMGLATIREKARIWLKSVEQEKPLWELDQKNRALKAEIDDLKQTISNLVARIEGGESDNTAQSRRARSRAVKNAKEMVE